MIVFFVLATSCADGGGTSTTVHSDSAGIDIAFSGAVHDSLGWRFESVRVLGGEDPGPESFYAAVPGLVEADAAGNLYVLDSQAHRVVVFDSTGAFVRAMGREGGAPDEFRMALGFDVAADGTASIFDLGKRGIMRFGPNAEVLDLVDAPADYRGGGFHLEGTVLIIPRQMGNQAEGVQVLSRIAGSDTTNLARVTSPAGRAIQLASCGMGFSSMPPMFTPTLRWASAGPRTAIATAAEYDILIIDGDSLIRRIRRDIAPAPATMELAVRDLGDAMQVRTEGGVRRCDPTEVVEQRGVADLMPAIARMAIDPANRLWVEHGHVRGETAPIDIFDAEGDYIGTLPAGTPFPVAFLTPHRLAAVETDEFDVSRLVIYRVET
jgi:hypothetical protein